MNLEDVLQIHDEQLAAYGAAGYQAMRDAMGKGKAKAKPAAKTGTPAKKTPARRKVS